MFIAATDSSKFAAAVAVWSCFITFDSSLSVQNVGIELCQAWETDLHVIHPLRTLGLLALILIVQSVFGVKGMSGSLGMLTRGNSLSGLSFWGLETRSKESFIIMPYFILDIIWIF
jgi:hypothetical protein